MAVHEHHDDELFLSYQQEFGLDAVLTGRGDEYQYGQQHLRPGTPIATEYRAWATATAARLRVDGWRVRDVRPRGFTEIDTGAFVQDGVWLWATRDGLSLEVEADTSTVGVPVGSIEPTATSPGSSRGGSLPPRSSSAWPAPSSAS